jgi:hypothetical protein
MPRKGGYYKSKAGGKPELVKATRAAKRDRNNRIVNPDPNSLVKGRVDPVLPDDSGSDTPKAQADSQVGSNAGTEPASAGSGKSGKAK